MLNPHAQSRFKWMRPRLLRWYRANGRPFLWRDEFPSAYIVLVSEFMLQQTGTTQVMKKLPSFLKKFPTVSRLANASIGDVLREWQGLGYNRRALNLHRAAKAIQERPSFPKTYDELILLPGVGDYTASAILAFSLNENVAVVDVNIERVLSRFWKNMKLESKTLAYKQIRALDLHILPKGRSSLWHQALMDLGATICTKRKPKCLECPLLAQCRSANKIKPDVTANKIEPIHFGLPLRIWRGRVLKVISDLGPVTIKALSRQMKKQYTELGKAPESFVTLLLSALLKDSLIVQHSGSFSLPE